MKLSKSLTALTLALVLALPFGASAAVNKAYVGNPYFYGTNDALFDIWFFDGNNQIDTASVDAPINGVTSSLTLQNVMLSATQSKATSLGYTVATSSVIMPPLWQADVNTLIATATSSLTLPVPMSFATSSRSLNSAFQVSASRAAFVSYTVDVATTLSLSGGQTGTIFLEYADDSGFTTNVSSIQSSVNGNTGTLTIGLNTTQTASASLTGMIPSGKYVRLRTVNTTGTPTFTFRAAQEVLMPSN